MRKHLLRATAGTLLMLGCVVAAVFITPLWSEPSGRDLRPAAFTMSVLIFLVGLVLRAFGWSAIEFALTLISIHVVALFVIGHFSGFTGLELFDSFNLWWLGWITGYITVPWVIGFAIGSLGLRLSRSEPPPGKAVEGSDGTEPLQHTTGRE